jgi:hypothetical protein
LSVDISVWPSPFSEGAAFFMSPEDQATAFSQDLAALIDRYAQEFELNYATIIGVLAMHQTILSLDAVAAGDAD